MTEAEVRKCVEGIKALAGDPEAAHGAEDALFIAVLEEIAGGCQHCESSTYLCREALKTLQINFERWCA